MDNTKSHSSFRFRARAKKKRKEVDHKTGRFSTAQQLNNSTPVWLASKLAHLDQVAWRPFNNFLFLVCIIRAKGKERRLFRFLPPFFYILFSTVLNMSPLQLRIDTRPIRSIWTSNRTGPSLRHPLFHGMTKTTRDVPSNCGWYPTKPPSDPQQTNIKISICRHWIHACHWSCVRLVCECDLMTDPYLRKLKQTAFSSRLCPDDPLKKNSRLQS